MPNPSSTLSSLQPQLDTFYEYVFESGVYIAEQAYRPVTPMKQAGSFGKVPIEELLKLDSNLERAPGSGYQRDTMQFTDVSYSTVEYGYEEVIDDRESQMYSSYFAAEAIATQRALNRMAVALEKRVATQLFNTTTFTGAQAGSPWQWCMGHVRKHATGRRRRRCPEVLRQLRIVAECVDHQPQGVS